MKIIKLTAENIKKLRAVEISPDGAVIEVTGPNGSGKTSVLDSIYYALAGGETIPTQVVRRGEDKAFVKLDLGEIVVTRRFTANGNTSLIVEAQSGARFPSPQRMLDELIGALSFDPLEFVRLDPKDQLDELRRVVTVDVDLDALDGRTRTLVEERTRVNRDLRSAEANLAAAPDPTDAPENPVDIAALMDEIQDANEHNTLMQKRREEREGTKAQFAQSRNAIAAWRKTAVDDVAAADEKVKQLEAQIEKIRVEARAAAKRAEENGAKLQIVLDQEVVAFEALEPVPANVETGPMVQRAREAEGVNKRVEQRAHHVELDARVQRHKVSAAALTEQIDANAKLRGEAIARATMPVEGLGFGDSQVVYNGLPLENASSAEQLRVSVGIAMAANPKLRVMRVRDGSLLDADSMKMLADLVAANDFQLWIERVEETDQRPTVVMEDGAVRAATAGSGSHDSPGTVFYKGSDL